MHSRILDTCFWLLLCFHDVNRSLLAVLTKAGAQQLPATEHTTTNGLPVGSSGAMNPLNSSKDFGRRSQPLMTLTSFKGRGDPTRVLSKSLGSALVGILGGSPLQVAFGDEQMLLT